MTGEQKYLLLTEINRRLPYGLTVSVTWKGFELNGLVYKVDVWKEKVTVEVSGMKLRFPLENVRPYLKRKNQMTPKENIEYQRRIKLIRDYENTLYWCDTPESLEWLDQNGYDYKGLLDMGLALEHDKLYEP